MANKGQAEGKKGALQKMLLVDVRTPEEFNTDHFPESLNVPLQTVDEWAVSVPKNSCIVVCCASGGRSATAAQLLKSLGFSDITDVGAWQNLATYCQELDRA